MGRCRRIPRAGVSRQLEIRSCFYLGNGEVERRRGRGRERERQRERQGVVKHTRISRLGSGWRLIGIVTRGRVTLDGSAGFM